MNESLQPEPPWHRQFWPWFLIALPATAVVASFATLMIAVNNAPDLVVDDYDRIGEISLAQMGRDRQAALLGLSASVTLSPAASNGQLLVRVTLAGNAQAKLPSLLVLRTTHSTLAKLDTSTELAGTAGRYTGAIDQPGGSYDLHLEDPERSWKLSTRVNGSISELTLRHLALE